MCHHETPRFAFRLGNNLSLQWKLQMIHAPKTTYFMQRVSASQRRDLDIGPAFVYQKSMLLTV